MDTPNTKKRYKRNLIHYRQYALHLILLLLTMPLATKSQKILFNMGDVTKGDRRFIYPSRQMIHKPIGGFLKDIPQIKIEPRSVFLRSHNEKCVKPARGHFESHNQVFWYCGDKTIEISDPTKSGQRETFKISDAPVITDILFLLPLSKSGEVAIISKLTSKVGEYEIYLKDKKLAYKFVPDVKDSNFRDAKKLGAIIPTKNSGKKQEIYFYAEGSTIVYQFKLDAKDSTSATKKIDIKTELKIKHEKLTKIENFLVSENYLTFAGYEDGQSYIFTCPGSKTETHQLKTCVKEEIYKVSKNIKVWGYREKKEYMNVIIWINDKSNGVNKMQIGYFESEKEKTRNKLGEYLISKNVEEGKEGIYLGDIHFQNNYVRLSFRDKTKIVSIWNVWSNSKKTAQRTRALIPAGMTELVFIAPDFYIGIKKHFEHNYNFLNFVFDPSNIKSEKFQHDIVCSKPDGTHVDYNFQANLVNPTDVQFAASSNSKQVKIKAVLGTMVEYTIPEVNFRGNNLMFSIESAKKNKVNLVAEKYFEMKSDKNAKIEILDDLFGQSFNKDAYSFHSCELDIDVSLKATCKIIGSEIKYKGAVGGNMKVLAQLNSVKGIYTVFEGKDSKLGLGIYEKSKSTLEDITEIDVKSDLGGDGKPDFIALEQFKKNIYLYVGKGSVIVRMKFKNDSGQVKQTFDISKMVPTNKGKNCKPIELRVANFFNEKLEFIRRSYVTFNCGDVNTIVEMLTPKNMKEILNYDNKKVKTCVTKAGIIHADISQTQHDAYIIRSENMEKINYELGSFNVKTITNLICDHPGEGHVLVQAKDSSNKEIVLMLNIQEVDPLNLIYTRFESPYSDLKKVQTSRYHDYYVLTFTNTKNEKKYLVINTFDKEMRIKADENFKIQFRAGIYNKPKSDKDFTVDIQVETTKVPETKIVQRPNKFSTFDKKGIYDLDDFFLATGPVKDFKVEIPESLKKGSKVVSLYPNKRSEIEDNKKDINFPSSQETTMSYSDGRFVVMRSNEYETEIYEIITSTNPPTNNIIMSFEESCREMTFSARANVGSVYLSCPEGVDIIVNVKVENGKLVRDGMGFIELSKTSRVVHLDGKTAAVAKSRRSGKSTFSFELYTVPDKNKVSKVFLKPKFKNDIEESKFKKKLKIFRCYFRSFQIYKRIRNGDILPDYEW